MRPVMYIFANRGLGMSPGKLAAQVGHAAVEAYKLSDTGPEARTGILQAWYKQGHTKLVMLAEDTEQLMSIDRYLKDRGYRVVLIIDEGRTEVRPFTPTVLGVELVDKDDPDVQAIFGSFKTYREEKKDQAVVSGGSDQKFWSRIGGRHSS